MKKHVLLLLLVFFPAKIFGQTVIVENIDSVSLDKIVRYFQEWPSKLRKSEHKVTKESLFKTDQFNLSISNKPIDFKTSKKVLANPGGGYPVSYSVILANRLISLFDSGRFVCHRLENMERDVEFEKQLNTRKFEYHWILNDKLCALSGNSIYAWETSKWVKSKESQPGKHLIRHHKLFEDDKFRVSGDCFGEWGGTVYFFDKVTGETYFAESTCTNTVTKEGDNYLVLASLGHMMGASELKSISDPTKLTKASKKEIYETKRGQALGYNDTSGAYKKEIDFFRTLLFSTFKTGDRRLYIVNQNGLSFIAEIDGKEIQIVHPLFGKEVYTHEPVTTKYGDYFLVNLDHYATAKEREISMILIHGTEITKIDWNEKH